MRRHQAQGLGCRERRSAPPADPAPGGLGSGTASPTGASSLREKRLMSALLGQRPEMRSSSSHIRPWSVSSLILLAGLLTDAFLRKAQSCGLRRQRKPALTPCPSSADGNPCGCPARSVSELFAPVPSPHRDGEGAPSWPEGGVGTGVRWKGTGVVTCCFSRHSVCVSDALCGNAVPPGRSQLSWDLGPEARAAFLSVHPYPGVPGRGASPDYEAAILRAGL